MNLRLAAASLSTTPLDWTGNLALCREAVARARSLEAEILVLPELCLTGYGCEDLFLGPWVPERALASLRELAADLPEGMLVAAGLPLRLRGKVRNAAALLSHDRLHGLACKRHLAREGLHYEPRWFTPWPAGQLLDDPDLGCPVGDQVFEWQGVRIGFEICEDAWALHRPGLELAAAECDILLSPSASHFALGKDPLRERLVVEGSRALGVAYAYANLSGNEAGRVLYDGLPRIAAGGLLLAEGASLPWSPVQVVSADIDLDRLRTQRAVSGHQLPGPAPRATRIDLPRRSIAPRLAAPEIPVRVPDDHLDFARAAALGLWDYLRKSRSRGFVLSLSGGADSAACAVLVHLALHWALEERGPDQVRRDLSWIDLPRDLDAAAMCRELLLCAYQATRNSGAVTLEAARAVAAGTGADFREWNVEELVQGYLGIGEAALGRPLSWASDDLALQNIQARVRAPSVWLLANATGRLLLTTSNRSEMAVGYATMDGDTAGSVSPLAGIDKHFLLGWLRRLERDGLPGVPALPWLSAITAQAPTAELRPRREGEAEQTDEADLMPYPLLSRLEALAIRERRSPAQCLDDLLRDEHWNRDPELLRRSVDRFFRLWARNQWKRERYAPSFHLDAHDLDPRAWCRFPILSSGFAEELGDLA